MRDESPVSGEHQNQCERFIPPFLTVKQFPEYFAWPSEAGLRWLLFHRKTNGLDEAVIQIGRRLLIDHLAFKKWMRTQGKEK